jgi:altronate dehydratase small subunit
VPGEALQADALVLDAADDVAVLIRPAAAGSVVQVLADGRFSGLEMRTAVPAGHKIARRAMATGDTVRKHGEVIGKLTAPVEAGEHVHVHNLVSLRV